MPCLKYCIQNKERREELIGVSPAYYISRYGTGFTIDDIVDGMGWLASHHFSSLQLEVFHRNRQLKQWNESAATKIKESLERYGLKASQFVAHFLLKGFDCRESLENFEDLNALENISVLLHQFSLTDRVTIPIPPFSSFKHADRDILFLFDEKVRRAESILGEKGLMLSLEPMPGGLASDLSFLNRHTSVGLNLDPGHLLCSGIDPFSLDLSVLSRVRSTHLCENDGKENLSLRPGSLSRRWFGLLGNLRGAGYDGALDLEIISPSGDWETEYLAGRFFLENKCIQNNVYESGVVNI
jgi:sugar phosphate isomerase/epimerase